MWRRHSENDQFSWQIQGRKLKIAVSGEHRHEAYQLLIFVGVGLLGAGIFSLGDILSNWIATINGDYLTCMYYFCSNYEENVLKAWLNRLWSGERSASGPVPYRRGGGVWKKKQLPPQDNFWNSP